MARQMRRFGPFIIVFAVVFGISALFLTPPREAHATVTYSDPYWSSNSPSPPCASCQEDCSPKPPEYSIIPFGNPYLIRGKFSNRTGELAMTFPVARQPGKLHDFVFAIHHYSWLDGGTQVGNKAILSFEHTVEKVILYEPDPDASGGHEVLWRQPNGVIVTWDWDGSVYSTQDCSVTETLVVNGSGKYVIEDKWGNLMEFDSNGMPSLFTDRNGNEMTFTYNGSLQLTDLDDTRGGDWDFGHNASGYLDEVTTPGGDTWDLYYDIDGNLIGIGSPATADQTGGVDIEINHDASDRITSVEDGLTNVAGSFTYVGSGTSLDEIDLDGDTIELDYASGRTDVTDRDGDIRRYHYTDATITKTDMYVGTTAKYETDYTYSGHLPVTIVFPRGNRVDLTYDGSDNLTERRHKTSDTSSSSSSDIVHAWTYSNNFVSSYTSPEGDVTNYTRDSAGNVTKIKYPNVSYPVSQTNVEKSLEYNSSGQLTKITDEEGKVIQRSYHTTGNGIHLLGKVEVDPAGLDLETEYDYDTRGNLDSITDGEGNETTLNWDAVRRLTKRTAPSPLSYETKYNYDANGNLTKAEVENIDPHSIQTCGDQIANHRT